MILLVVLMLYQLYHIWQKIPSRIQRTSPKIINIQKYKTIQSINTNNILVQKHIQKNINTNHITTTYYNNQGNVHDKISTKSRHPTRSDTTKVDSNIARQKNTKNDTYISNKISVNRKNTHLLLQYNHNKNTT